MPLSSPVQISVDVEVWLGDLERVMRVTLDQLLKLYKKILIQELINSNQHNQHMIRLGGFPPHSTRFEPDPGTDTPKDFVRIYLRDSEQTKSW